MASNVAPTARKKSYPGRPSSRGPDAKGSRTLATGLSILKNFMRTNGPVSVSDMARLTGLSANRVSRYLGTLAQSGFLAQNQNTGRFDLGPAVFELGMFAFGKVDGVKLAANAMQQLTAATRLVSVLCVWGTNGPTVIRGERGDLDIAVRIREGINLSTIATATGRIFLAYQDSADAQAIFDRDLADWNREAPRHRRFTRQDVDAIRRDVRRAGYAQAEGLRAPMLSAIAVPVTGRNGKLVMSLCLVGTKGFLRVQGNESEVGTLKAAAKGLSEMLCMTQT